MRILVVDDHAVVRPGTRELLAEEFPRAVFDEAATGEDAVVIVGREALDLVVLDIAMPRRGGMDALRDIRARKPRLPILVQSHHAEEQYAVRALRVGARGYITKESAPEELVRAVHKVLSGGTYVSPALAERLAGGLAADADQPLHARLSDRELEVLRKLADGMLVRDIAIELSLSEKTVSTYRTRVLEKMAMTTTAELMRYALRVGLVD